MGNTAQFEYLHPENEGTDHYISDFIPRFTVSLVVALSLIKTLSRSNGQTSQFIDHLYLFFIFSKINIVNICCLKNFTTNITTDFLLNDRFYSSFTVLSPILVSGQHVNVGKASVHRLGSSRPKLRPKSKLYTNKSAYLPTAKASSIFQQQLTRQLIPRDLVTDAARESDKGRGSFQ